MRGTVVVCDDDGFASGRAISCVLAMSHAK